MLTESEITVWGKKDLKDVDQIPTSALRDHPTQIAKAFR